MIWYVIFFSFFFRVSRTTVVCFFIGSREGGGEEGVAVGKHVYKHFVNTLPTL